MRRILLGSVCTVVLVVALHGTAGQTAAHPTQLDLGEVARDAQATGTITVRNSGQATQDMVVRIDVPGELETTASPAAFALGHGATRKVSFFVQPPADASPGRHTVEAVVAANDTGGGNTAYGGVRVLLHVTVATTDVTALTLLANDTLHGRIVNGHGTSRDVTMTMVTKQGSVPVERLQVEASALRAQGSQLVYWPLDAAAYAEGDIRLEIAGMAVGGPADESFDAQLGLRKVDGELNISDEVPEVFEGGGGSPPGFGKAPTGGGGGGVGSMRGEVHPLAPAAPGDDAREGSQTGIAEEPSGSQGGAGDSGQRVDVLPRGLELVREGLVFSLVATGIALVSATLIVVARGWMVA